MARAKSPAQLQREINEALRQRAMSLDPAQVGREITEGFARQRALERGLTAAQRAYVTALEEDVRLFPDAYKAAVRANPSAWAVKLAEGLSDADAREMARDQRAETKRTQRALGRTLRAHSTKKHGRRYHVVVINERTGKKGYMTATPVTHREGTTILRKITDYPWRRKQLEEVS